MNYDFKKDRKQEPRKYSHNSEIEWEIYVSCFHHSDILYRIIAFSELPIKTEIVKRQVKDKGKWRKESRHQTKALKG